MSHKRNIFQDGAVFEHRIKPDRVRVHHYTSSSIRTLGAVEGQKNRLMFMKESEFHIHYTAKL